MFRGLHWKWKSPRRKLSGKNCRLFITVKFIHAPRRMRGLASHAAYGHLRNLDMPEVIRLKERT